MRKFLDYEQNPVLFLFWSYWYRVRHMLPDALTKRTKKG